MITTDRDEKVMVFIDLRNVLRNAEELSGIDVKVDFDVMVEAVVKGRKLVAAYMFDSIESERDPCYNLHDALRCHGYRVITRIGYDKVTGVQKEVDVAMACEILSHAYKNNYDTAIIISGDRDFRPAIEHIQSAGKRAEVAGISKGMSWKLSRSGDMFHDLDKLPLFYLKPTKDEQLAWEPAFMLEDILSGNLAEAV
jgi:uncharacterized LabA/DUF88 family protein